MPRTSLVITLGLAAALALPGCTTTATTTAPTPPIAPVNTAANDVAPEALSATYAALKQAGGGQVWALDAQASAVRIQAFRTGPGARFGHNHVLTGPRFTGFVHLPPSGVAGARFDLAFRLDELDIDDAQERARLGAAYASQVSAESRAGTRANMLGELGLQASRFPLVRIRSLAVSGEAPWIAVKVEVTLHGQQRVMWVPLKVEGLPEHLRVQGALVLRQTDFGVKPYSLLGGVLAVADEVVVTFDLVGG
jgi:polyisoprenoid-binding protein YceI